LIIFALSGGEKLLIGELIAYYFVVNNLVREVNKIIDSMLSLDDLSSNLALVNKSVEILSENEDPLVVHTFSNGDIIFNNVVFAYPSRFDDNILKNFSFCFEKGKSYGIAGKNGIGKSTITKTTLKLYDLKEGEITIDGKNVNIIETKSLRERICHQTNRPGFFHLSIAENVFYPYYYDKEKDFQKLEEAAKKVGIIDFISKLPNGFDTVIKEGGSDLSEGQKQQISAMKIFTRDYDIYILDEILSNVHPLLRLEIIKNIFEVIKGKTTIVIDHHYEIFNFVDEVYKFTGRNLLKEKEDEQQRNN
jgi:ATP-binding cassette subfamily B protein